MNIWTVLWTRASCRFITLTVKHSYYLLEEIEGKYHPHSIHRWDEMVSGETLKKCNRATSEVSPKTILREDLIHLIEQLMLLKNTLSTSYS